MSELREIFYCNLIVTHKGEKIKIKEVVYKPTDNVYRNLQVLEKYGIKKEIKVDKIEVIKSLGFEQPVTESRAFEKSDEKRNKIGAYE